METLSSEQWETFRSAMQCHVCKKPFVSDDTRVCDHCHLTGRYRDPAHLNCNLNYKNSYYIPVIFHNLSGHDAHFIIKEITIAFKGKIDLLPIIEEKYISFTKQLKIPPKDQNREPTKLWFIDLYKFLNTSLDKLAFFLSKDKLKI